MTKSRSVQKQPTRVAVERQSTGGTSTERPPSRETDAFWIDAFRLHASRRGRTIRKAASGGKWMIFVPRARIDDLWATIRKATEEGYLGDHAKVSTARPNPNSADPSKHVICVYTDDAEDEADIREVRQALRDLGVSWKIPYKSDAATRAGKYQVRGNTRIASFYE